MIGVIGLGGAGGNIADEANKRGFLTAAINFSQKDLDAVEVKHKLRLNGSEGVGKNRDEAITLIQDQWEIPVKFIQDNFSNVDVIVFAFSSSGGSGSGISPILLDILTNTMPDKVFTAFVVIPDNTEATVSKINCLKCFEELSRLDISIFPIDNQQVKTDFMGKNKIFEETNKNAIDLLSKITSYTEKYSKHGNFDKTDLLTILRTKGIALMSQFEIAKLNQNLNLTVEGIAKSIQTSWQSSVFTKVNEDKVVRAGIVFDGQEELMSLINHELIFSNFHNGLPVDLFEGYYHEQQERLLTILSGLSWCSDRLQDIENSIDSEKVGATLATNTEYVATSATSLLSKIRGSKQEVKKPVSEIFSKYRR